MSSRDEELARWEARFARERRARQEAERVLEDKSRELYEANEALRSLAAELLAARDAAEQASRAKSAFLATMSHELRTPLNGVLGMTDVLTQRAHEPEQLGALETIRTSGRHLLGLLDELLDFSKIEAGQLELEPVEVDLPALVDEAVGALSAPAARRPVILSLDLDPDLPRTVRADPARLRQVLTHLVGNAIKFGRRDDQPWGRVDVHARRDDAGVSFVIRDEGVGIGAEARARLFHPFVQGDGSNTRRYGGAGLGLAMCRRLVDAMGGTIDIDGAPGAGTTCTVVLPLRATGDLTAVITAPGGARVFVDPSGPAPTAARSAAGPHAVALHAAGPHAVSPDDGAPRVLVAEDEATNRLVVARQLRLLGCHVTLTHDGEEALETWRRERFDLVLSDLHMPRRDGYGLVAALRAAEARGEAARTPVLALTANAIRGEAAHARAAGFDAYLTKPLPLAELRVALEAWIEPARWARRARPPLAPSTSLPPRPAPTALRPSFAPAPTARGGGSP
jgi:signal transduction histidine kinase/DNA-binding NarL/FixJ family response regulator